MPCTGCSWPGKGISNRSCLTQPLPGLCLGVHCSKPCFLLQWKAVGLGSEPAYTASAPQPHGGQRSLKDVTEVARSKAWAESSQCEAEPAALAVSGKNERKWQSRALEAHSCLPGTNL